jgi:hypothetical protein
MYGIHLVSVGVWMYYSIHPGIPKITEKYPESTADIGSWP